MTVGIEEIKERLRKTIDRQRAAIESTEEQLQALEALLSQKGDTKK